MEASQDVSAQALAVLYVGLTKMRVLASLGAINMILVLLFGSFAQQSVSLPIREISSGNGSIAKCVEWVATTGWMDTICA